MVVDLLLPTGAPAHSHWFCNWSMKWKGSVFDIFVWYRGLFIFSVCNMVSVSFLLGAEYAVFAEFFLFGFAASLSSYAPLTSLFFWFVMFIVSNVFISEFLGTLVEFT
jgi:hypothetical protein